MAISEKTQSDQKNAKPLRFITCGNVDDGKSTLIGRLLWDTGSVKLDHAAAVEAKPVHLANGETHPDFANLVDGLQAEREQGITIDVAYRYFSSAQRAFIVADTPGHEQYTRNMVTGASTADVAVLLVDAQTGIREQTRRHALVASIMGIRTLVLAVNKMDLIGYDQRRFEAIAADFKTLTSWIEVDALTVIPVAAVHGFNVVRKDDTQLEWYQGPTLLQALENTRVNEETDTPFRMNVQRVSRPDERFRGFQGTVTGRRVRVGEEVMVQRSNHKSSIQDILTFDGSVQFAEPGDAVTLVLDRKVDIARGDTILDAAHPMQSAHSARAKLIVLDDRGLAPGKRYWLKSGAHRQRVTVRAEQKIDLATGNWQDHEKLGVNTILHATLSFDEPYYFDRFAENGITGSFILIDPDDFSTVAGGMIEEASSAAVSAHGVDIPVHISLPADMAAEVLALASNNDRLSEMTIDVSPAHDLNSDWIRDLEARGLTLAS